MDRAPRESTDQEAAPLLRNSEYDPDGDEFRNENAEPPTLLERINAIAQEPLTPLTQVLLVVVLILLLLSSVFIGLFAGEYTKLKQHERDDDRAPPTITVTATSVITTTAAPPGPTSPPAEHACLTSECIILSASILSSLDESQDPCENFFDFANGGWIADHPLPADKGSFGQFEALSQDNKRVIQHFLETPSATSAFTTSDDDILLQKLRNFYSSCLNENRLDEIGTEPLIHFVKTLQRLFRGQGLEVKDEKITLTVKGLTAAMAFLHSRGVDALFSFSVEGDVGVDPNYMALWFDQASLGLPAKEYYEEDSIVQVYQNIVARLLYTLSEEEEKLQQNPTPSFTENDRTWPSWPWPPWDTPEDEEEKPNRTEIAHKLAKKVVKFETRLANATLDPDVYQDPFATYNRLPLSNLTESLPEINFSEYFATFTPRTFPEYVIITYPAYPSSVSEILSETSAEVIEAYLVVRAALALSPNLGMATEAWQAQRALVETLTGIKKGAVGDRAEYCVGKVEQTLGFAAGRYFVNETFGGDSREKGTKVITDIIAAFKASLPNVPWLDKTSADAAAEKADAIRVKVGYPISPDTRDPASILRYYRTVNVDEDTYFENILSAAASDSFKSWLQLGQRRNFNQWEMWPSMVNAYFNPPANEIVFPAGILQPPFFSRDWPSYLSYGGFGMVAAHELTHAFDSAGRLYNQEGKLENWWTNSSNAGFQVRQECIEAQYSAYTVDDGKGGKIHVNGIMTSGENIGDTGLIQAYRAWKAQYSESFQAGGEFLLPGMKYTREQLFFISFGRIWANTMKTAAQVQRVRTDPHSPNIYRVEGTLSNIPEFASAFNCSKTAKLNPPPEKQCRFWS
ncbi:Endothelin-converting enzyme 1 [Mycena sanguinolenta]|uniref:Endothelin-converting enzyme 1 n=1 Tax=Mycena sanguinolenta TaxID=230812 RepID=A0A8H6YII0_9AGAR|nr:Endothelin-converting enzyme 1 [Mycena sanguinolenta]